MALFTNADTYRLQMHTGLHQLAINMSAVFSSAYLLKIGLSFSQVFMAYGGMLAFRFLVRPAMLLFVPAVGVKPTLIAGTVLIALQYLTIAFVDAFDWKLIAYSLFGGLASMVYWTAFHPAFAAAGERHDRGRQMGARQSLTAAASIAGPGVTGFILTLFGPWAAFGSAALVTLIAAIPLFAIANTPVLKTPPPGSWQAPRLASGLFFADGFLWMGAGTAWMMVLFERLGSRYDAYGSALAAAAVAAALASWLTGRSIDLGRGHRAVLLTVVLATAVFSMRALVGANVSAIIGVAIASTITIGLYMPSLMTVFYHEAKAAPCAFRFQMAAEAAWDAGGFSASAVCCALLYWGAPLQPLVWLALPAIALQGLLLRTAYNRHASAPA